jgi:hypothetical protein
MGRYQVWKIGREKREKLKKLRKCMTKDERAAPGQKDSEQVGNLGSSFVSHWKVELNPWTTWGQTLVDYQYPFVSLVL